MRFEMDNILLDQILFYMENQDSDFFLDTQERKIIDILNNEAEFDLEKEMEKNKERFITLPRWLPTDGYRLMEKFSANLKNLVARHELAQALNRNKGVFRAFRNTLEQYPEIEKMWYSYKDTEMKKIILLWYNALREEWGLSPIGSEPEDTSSLVLEDFFIKETEESGTDSCLAFIAESVNGETAGLIKGEIIDSVFHINIINVKPEYQGLGLGKTLLSKIIEEADKRKLEIMAEVPFEVEFFTRSLYLENFKPVSQKFIRHITCSKTR